jgi:hypothetical protein
VETNLGRIAERNAAAGHSSVLAELAGFRLPVTGRLASHGQRTGQADAGYGDRVAGDSRHVSQSDKGEIVIERA